MKEEKEMTVKEFKGYCKLLQYGDINLIAATTGYHRKTVGEVIKGKWLHTPASQKIAACVYEMAMYNKGKRIIKPDNKTNKP